MQVFCSLGRMDPVSVHLRERLHLAKDVFFCITAGQGIFLDLRRDTYSSVPVPDDVVGSRGCLSETALAAAFAPFRQELLDEGLVSQTPVDGRRFGAFQGIRRPSAHLLEPVDARAFGACRGENATRITLSDVIDVQLACRRAGRLLRRQHIRDIVQGVRDRKAAAGSPWNDHADLARQTAVFRALRPWSPRQYNCLLEALALLEFLARRDLFPTWVFGVQAKPFGAHCWIQEGGYLLNETVEYAGQFTAIMAA